MITAAIIAKIVPWLIGIMGLLGVYWRGHHNGKVKATRDVMDRYAKTREKMDAAESGNDDPDVLREWMRQRDERAK